MKIYINVYINTLLLKPFMRYFEINNLLNLRYMHINQIKKLKLLESPRFVYEFKSNIKC